MCVRACRYGGQLVDEEHSRSWLGYGNGEQCAAALTRMRQCSWCDGRDAKPCHGLCVNVVRGCLARETAHLDAPWTGYYEAVDRLVSAINNGQSSVCLEDLLRSLHSRISEAIMYAMNHASDIQSNVSEIFSKLFRPSRPREFNIWASRCCRHDVYINRKSTAGVL